MENHDIEIEIGPDGRVRASVKGAKGKACLEYAEFLIKTIGKLESKELTSEYYEPDSQVRIEPLIRGQERR